MCKVVDCRRILKWTYTYGYYIFGEQSDQAGASIPKEILARHQVFFEFNQVSSKSMLPLLCPFCWTRNVDGLLL